MPETTKDGKMRYPPDGYYRANYENGTACTCEENCPGDCNGKCGCEACHESYGDFVSSE